MMTWRRSFSEGVSWPAASVKSRPVLGLLAGRSRRSYARTPVSAPRSPWSRHASRPWLLAGDRVTGCQCCWAGIRRWLARQGLVRHRSERRRVAVGMLDVDLGDLLIYGWRTHRRLLDAAKATLRATGSEAVVRLGSHRISSAQHPTVDLLIDDVCVHILQFDLMMIFDIDVAVAIIRDGNLVALKCGDGSTGRAQRPDPRR
jgi:hypothetical protein